MRHERQTGSHGSDVSVRPPQKSARRSRLNTRQDLYKTGKSNHTLLRAEKPCVSKNMLYFLNRRPDTSVFLINLYYFQKKKNWALLNQAKKNSISLLERSSSEKTTFLDALASLDFKLSVSE